MDTKKATGVPVACYLFSVYEKNLRFLFSVLGFEAD